jgi:glutamyl-tRNA reductase
MSILVVGVNHKVAPLELREKLAFYEGSLPEALELLLSCTDVSGGVIVSTCNRTEVYAEGHEVEELSRQIKEFLSEYHSVPLMTLESHCYCLGGVEALNHLFCVGAGVDSMIVGEPQVLGQLKSAYEKSRTVGCAGKSLNLVFQKAFNVAKKVRAETAIGRHPVSISYAAVRMLRELQSPLTDRVVVLVGAGEMCELAAGYLSSDGAKELIIANRTFGRAAELAKKHKAMPVPLDALHEALVRADSVIASTDASYYVITERDMLSVMTRRNGRPIILIDLSVPRDIEPSIGNMKRVLLYNIDDLKGEIEINRERRKESAAEARKVIEQEALGLWNRLELSPVLTAFESAAEKMRLIEVDECLNKIGHLSARDKELVRSMTASLVKKVFYHPMRNAGRISRDNGMEAVEIVKKIFQPEEDRLARANDVTKTGGRKALGSLSRDQRPRLNDVKK